MKILSIQWEIVFKFKDLRLVLLTQFSTPLKNFMCSFQPIVNGVQKTSWWRDQFIVKETNIPSNLLFPS